MAEAKTTIRGAAIFDDDTLLDEIRAIHGLGVREKKAKGLLHVNS